MTVAITCDCGDDVPFDVTTAESVPVRTTCSECGQSWELNVHRLLPDVRKSTTDQ